MTARDAATAALDLTVGGITTDATTAAELFAVVDLLDGQPMLRRSLSDPSASDESRAELAQRLFAGRVAPATRVFGAALIWGSLCLVAGWLWPMKWPNDSAQRWW
mgnify:CR=1 FL=1